MPEIQQRRTNCFRWIRAIFLTLLASSVLTCSGAKPHFILMILVDTLRADHLGCYGYEPIDTPNIDRLAETGTLYENAITSVPVTLPAITTILTGAYPVQHGVRDNGPFQLSDRWITVAELLQEAGYETAAFVSAEVLSREHNLAQGFATYDDDVSEPYTAYNPEIAEIQEQFQGIERRADSTVDRVLNWLQTQPRRNTFLLVHLFDPHVPQDPPPPFHEQYAEQPYDGEIAYVDREIGRLLDNIQEQWSGAKLQIVFVADHGEGLGDHDEIMHGDLLFDETIRVPLILQGEGIGARVRENALVRTVDIVPTICALAGIESPEWSVGAVLPGIEYSTNRAEAPPTPPFRHAAYVETFRPRLSYNWCELRSVRTEEWKLIEGPIYELYDLWTDPAETRNVAGLYPVVRDSLTRFMDDAAFWSVRHGAHAAGTLELNEQQRKKLESLGYITPESTRPITSDSLAIWYFPEAERGRTLGLPHPRLRVRSSSNRQAAENLCMIAYRALKSGDLLEAERRFEAAIRYRKKMPMAYLGLAEVTRQSGRTEESERYLRQAWETISPDPLMAAAIVDGFVRIGLYDEALRVVDDAVAGGYADTSLMEAAASLRKQLDEKR